MTKFEHELREALAVDDRPVNQLGAARYAFAMTHQKSHTSIIEDAAALLLEILPELREMVEAVGEVSNKVLIANFMSLQDALQKRDDIVYDAIQCLTEKLKKAGVV